MTLKLDLPLSKSRQQARESQSAPPPTDHFFKDFPIISAYTTEQMVGDELKFRITTTLFVPRSRFDLGKVYITIGAKEFLDSMNLSPMPLLARHQSGDWGDMTASDYEANEEALRDGARLFSSYRFNDGQDKVWVITEWDRSATTLLLPDEY